MKRIIFLLFTLFSVVAFASEDSIQLSGKVNYKNSEMTMSEVWGYLMNGEERFYSPEMPITDIGYFGAGIGRFGTLVGVPDRKKLPQTTARVHLVVAEVSGGYALTHFVLDPRYTIRDEIVQDIINAAENFDGVQIDFESVSWKDVDFYYDFLSMIKAGIGEKVLSIAIPARKKSRLEDPYEYTKLSKIADRIIIMAYDEHWSTSKPGSVASLPWCKEVGKYAKKTIGSEKLVMGLPFYGRAWGNVSTSKAYKFPSVMHLINNKDIKAEDIKREESVNRFEYDQSVHVTVFFDDVISTIERIKTYRREKVDKIAFWRLGQEDTEIWNHLRLKEVK